MGLEQIQINGVIIEKRDVVSKNINNNKIVPVFYDSVYYKIGETKIKYCKKMIKADMVIKANWNFDNAILYPIVQGQILKEENGDIKEFKILSVILSKNKNTDDAIEPIKI